MAISYGTSIITDNIICCLDPANPGSNVGNNILRDMSGNGNDATLNNGSISSSAYTTVNSSDGAVLSLDGPSIWTLSMLLTRTGAVTGSVGRIAGTNGVIDRGEIAIGLASWAGVSDRIYLNGPRASWTQTDVTIELNETAYLCFIFDRTQASSPNALIYKNGILEWSATQTGGDEGPITGYTLGSRSDFNGEYVPHSFHHVTVHDKALSANEIAANFEAIRRRVNL